MQTSYSLAWRGANIHYRRTGGGPVVLLLESEESLPDKVHFRAELAKRYDLIVPDHPGFGKSDTPVWLKGIGDTAYFYLDFLHELDLRNVHLVGCSLGGWIAAEIALRNCDRIASLSLLAPFGVRRKGARFGDIFMWTPEENIRHRLADQALAERFIAAARNHSQEEATAYLKDRYATARLGWHPRLHNPELERWLHRIARPTLLIWGEGDRVVPREVAATWQEGLPQAKLAVVPQCGHLPHLEHPETTAAHIASFISEVGA